MLNTNHKELELQNLERRQIKWELLSKQYKPNLKSNGYSGLDGSSFNFNFLLFNDNVLRLNLTIQKDLIVCLYSSGNS